MIEGGSKVGKRNLGVIDEKFEKVKERERERMFR